MADITSNGESSSAAVRRKLQPHAHKEESLPTTSVHDIFLSHSGAQKPFVKGLYKMLSPLYSTFFDIKHHSLPPGEDFATHIFDTANKCRLVVVVLSEEYFVRSKWPMLELAASVSSMELSVSKCILPLFYGLSPADVKCKDNTNRWCEEWQKFAARDCRVNVSLWQQALRQVCSIGGLVFDKSEGEAAFLDEIVSTICEIVPPTIKSDDTGKFGKDRLCKAIVTKFEKMESCGQQMEHYEHARPTTQHKPCVLGMYGLPGIGKTTLSKFLYQYFFPLYGGKVLYLELPTNPSPTDLINKFKEVLNLTHFRHRINLDKVSHLSEVYSLLKGHGLQELRVFVVVDNIVSDKSVEAVKDFLKLGVGPGSKVLLVARTLDFLQSALLLGKEGKHFISDSMCIPHITKAEAVGILLHKYGVGMGVKSTMTPNQSLVDVVRMCGFGSRLDDLLYLPLVMEIMGCLLMRYEGDVKKWTNALSRFRNKVKTHKEDAVREVVGTSFRELGDEELQLLFLDVTLFIIPLKLGSIQKALEVLRFLHACNLERMEKKIKDLQRHCFLRIDDVYGQIRVHDVYVEFAESIQVDPNFRRWHWMDYKCADAEAVEVTLRQEDIIASDDRQQVRTMIVEVGEGCKRVAMYGYVGLKALVVRNCKSLAVLALEGLTSLVSIDIQNCPCMAQIDSIDCDFNKVKRFNVQATESSASTLRVQLWNQLPHFCVPIVGFRRMIAAISSTRLSSPSPFFERIATQMRGLQVLRLEHTGVKRLVNMSSCWPQLRELYVTEYELEAVEIGRLQRLNRIKFCDHKLGAREDCLEADEEMRVLYEYRRGSSVAVVRNPQRKLKGMDMIKECPELEEVDIQSAFFEERHMSTLTPKVRSLVIKMPSALKLPDLTPSAPSLEEVRVEWCAKLERVLFFVKFERLTILELCSCWSLVEVTGLGFLHNLCYFKVRYCEKLQILVGLSGLTSLNKLNLEYCPELREIPSWNNLIRLKEVSVLGCHKLRNIPSLMGLKSLELIHMFENGCVKEPGTSEPAESESDAELPELSWYGDQLAGDQYSSHRSNPNLLHCQEFVIPSAAFEHLHSLALGGFTKLRSVRGIDSLIHLRNFYLGECPQLEELPSLHRLVELEQLIITKCGKLKALEGCDEMKSLHRVELRECRSLECFVVRDLHAFLTRIQGAVQIQGSKFASIEGMVEWAFDENRYVRWASEVGLEWEYRHGSKVLVVEAFFPTLVSKILLNEDDCFDCNYNMLRSQACDEKVRTMLQSVPKKVLLELSIDFRLSIFDLFERFDALRIAFRVYFWVKI